jgi:hypothetical protein
MFRNRIATYLDNSLMRIIGDIAMYTPRTMLSMSTKGAMIRIIGQLMDLGEALLASDSDKFWKTAERVFMPGAYNTLTKSVSEDYTPNDWVDEMFTPDEVKAKRLITDYRSWYRNELKTKHKEWHDNYIEHKVDIKWPTLTRKEKSGTMAKENYIKKIVEEKYPQEKYKKPE